VGKNLLRRMYALDNLEALLNNTSAFAELKAFPDWKTEAKKVLDQAKSDNSVYPRRLVYVLEKALESEKETKPD
jgi:hypothetical protein